MINDHAVLVSSGRGTTRAKDAQGTPTQGQISPSLLEYYDNQPGLTKLVSPNRLRQGQGVPSTRILKYEDKLSEADLPSEGTSLNVSTTIASDVCGGRNARFVKSTNMATLGVKLTNIITLGVRTSLNVSTTIASPVCGRGNHRLRVFRASRFRASLSSSLLLSSLELSDTKVYEPYIRARLGTASHFCKVVVPKLKTVPRDPRGKIALRGYPRSGV